MTEQWRDIPGWQGFYQVSDLGRVKSLAGTMKTRWPGVLRPIPERILKPTIHSRYLGVQLRRGSASIQSVHRLVLLAFVGEPPDGQMGCHNDGDTSNNALSNLRWDTASGNMMDKIRHGTNPEVLKTACPGGHPYDDANTYHTPQGHRKCRECHRLYESARRVGRVAA